MYGILCKKDGNAMVTIPIQRDEEADGILATWSSLDEAIAFAENHPLCQMSEVLIVDLTNSTIVSK